MTPQEAYWFVVDNPDCDIRKYQEIACQDPFYAYAFALDVICADIEYCHKYAKPYARPSARKRIEDFILKDL